MRINFPKQATAGPRRVPPEGPLKCKIAFIGEAPGGQEETEGRPFVGGSGGLLNYRLHRLGISRSDCYLTNVSKYRPRSFYKAHPALCGKPPKSANDFDCFWLSPEEPSQALLDFRRELLEELDSVEAEVFIALGANALWALTGRKKISHYRGNFFQVELPSGRKVTLLPTYHPAAAMRDMRLSPIIGYDIDKAYRQRDAKQLDHSFILEPTLEQVTAYCSRAYASRQLSFDIETSDSGIYCIGFSMQPDEAICIPTTEAYWGSPERLAKVWRAIGQALAGPGLKVAQNLSFDTQWLVRFAGVLPAGPWVDTMVAQHCCYPELPKSLEFLVSIYTNNPFYKEDRKLWASGALPDRQLYLYNCRDAAYTLEVWQALRTELAELGVMQLFEHRMLLLEPLIYMMLRGFDVDHAKLEEYRTTLLAELDKRQAALEAKLGPCNPNSSKQVIEFLERNNIPVPTYKGKPTTRKEKLLELAQQYPELASVLEVRETRKMLSNYLGLDKHGKPKPNFLDPLDGRFRFNISASKVVTGRLASSESSFWCGTNAQNWPKRIRDLLVPPPGYSVTCLDLKGAEAVVVAYDSQDEQVIKLLEAGGNIHNYTASLAFGVNDEQIAADRAKWKAEGHPRNSYYDRAKAIRHACNYLESVAGLAKQLRMPIAEANIVMYRFMQGSPKLTAWHERLRRVLLSKNPTITTPLGMRRTFYAHFDQKLLREAAAFIPQETVGHVINEAICAFYFGYAAEHPDVEARLQIHDEMVVTHPTEQRDAVIEALVKAATRPILLHGRWFKIAVEVSTGPNLRDQSEVTPWWNMTTKPTEEEFSWAKQNQAILEAAAKELRPYLEEASNG